MPNVTKIAPDFGTVQAFTVLANTANTGSQSSIVTLDLKTALEGAVIYGFIGRRNATALTRGGEIVITPSQNDTLNIPIQTFNIVGQIATCISTTMSAGSSIGDVTISITSSTSFAVGDTICIHSDDSNANRVEFARVRGVGTNQLTLNRALRLAHNNGDRVTTLADVRRMVLPPGDIYEIRCVNPVAGQDLVFGVYRQTDQGVTF